LLLPNDNRLFTTLRYAARYGRGPHRFAIVKSVGIFQIILIMMSASMLTQTRWNYAFFAPLFW